MKINNQAQNLEVSRKVVQMTVHVDGTREKTESHVVREHFLSLIINEILAVKLVCTSVDLAELVLGRMLSEGYIRSAEDVESIYICSQGSKAKVFLKEKIKFQESEDYEPTCCTGNQVLLKSHNMAHMKRLPKTDWKPEWVFRLCQEFAQDSSIHRKTRGTHSCYLGYRGEVVYVGQDIGRHNAMDKAVGYALREGLDRRECMLYTTGRVPTDMVQKVIAAGIPVLVSKAVPTDAAIEMAQHYNLTLICRAWPEGFEIYHQAQE